MSDYDYDNDFDTDEAPKTNTLMRRGFDGVALAHENAASQALVAKATADIQARWVMAMRCPRDPAMVRQTLIRECRRPGFAKEAIYAVPRGGNTIRGLSIRFAEVAMRCMGNMSCEAQTLFDSDEERVIRVTATDFEANATWNRDITVKKTVERRQLKRGQRAIRSRINSYGDTVHIVEATDDEVATKEAAMISKAARTAILRMVPGHLQDEAFEVCEQIAKNEAAKDPDAERNALFDAFAGLNITPPQIAEWLGHPVEQSTPFELVELRKLYRGIHEGAIGSWSEAMDLAADARARAKKDADAARKSPGPQGQASASQQAPAPAPGKQSAPRTSGGKGTQAAKDKIAGNAKDAAKETPAKEAPAPKDEQPTEAKAEPAPPSDHAAPAPAPATGNPDDFEMRTCFLCSKEIEVHKEAPGGASCKSCGGEW